MNHLNECNERGDSINQRWIKFVFNASLDILTSENIIWFTRKICIHIIMKGSQCLFSSSILHTYKF